MIVNRVLCLFSFVLIFSFNKLFPQDMARLIKEGNADSISFYINRGSDVNGHYPEYSMLEMAIKENQKKIVNLLFNYHADLNIVNHGNTPLIYSIYFTQKFNDYEIFNLLIEHGADINKPARLGVTPLIYACKSNNYVAATSLYERGADATITDDNGTNFFYFVLRGNDMKLRKYFISRGFAIPRLSSVTDGPYIKWIDENQVRTDYFQYDSLQDSSEIMSEILNINNNELLIHAGKNLNSGTFVLNTDKPESSVYNGISRIFAISDLHGNYDHFTKLLKANGIVDKKLNWIWGRGHLVILGDVFDRGENVMECLWLIYKLESQAEKKGGKVHYILGNHELMILYDNNKYYVNNKYIFLCAKTGLDYHDLFGSDYELGKWIRSKNIAVKINDFLFVHGGIPPEFPGMERTIDKMNDAIHYIMKIPVDSIDPYLNYLSIQPAWYRGYFDNRDQTKELNDILGFYKVQHIIVGHTPVRKISELQGGKVIAINLPFDDPSIKAEGLLMKDNQCYGVDESGNIIQILLPGP